MMIETLPKFSYVSLPLVSSGSLEHTTRLLLTANHHPPEWLRHEFYELKTEILRTKGRRCCPDHVQRIAKQCWGCYGSGNDAFKPHPCFRCGGSGFYSTRYVVLERWRLPLEEARDGYVEFHVPTDTVAKKGCRVDIEGYVVKTRLPDTEDAAMQLLWEWRPERFVELCVTSGRQCEADSPLGDLARHLAWSRIRSERHARIKPEANEVPF